MEWKETEKLELKEICDPNLLQKEIVAFANSDGGSIVIGINDQGQVVGIINPDQETLRITNMVRDTISPDLTMFIHYSNPIDNDHDLIKLDVQSGTDKPYFIRKKGLRPEGVFVRQGTSSAPASWNAIRKMITNTDGPDFETMRCLNQNLTFETATAYFNKKKVEFGEDQMRTLFLIENGLYTNLALLLSDQCPYTTKAAVFAGENARDFSSRKEFSGSILDQIDRVLDYLDTFNATSNRFDGIYRIDQINYDPNALREAVINSFLHRSYSISDSNIFRIYQDRIEITSLGGLTEGMSESDLSRKISVCRNQKLAKVLEKLDLIEAYGTGLQVIRDSYENQTTSPKIEVSPNSFTITLPKMTVSQIQTLRTVNTPPITANMSPNELSVLKSISEKDGISRAEIQSLVNLSAGTVTRILKKLRDSNIIQVNGKGKNTTYTMVKSMK